jgi:hypothetical protein
MLTLENTATVKDKLSAALVRADAAGLTVAPVTVALDGACYRVQCATTRSSHLVYIAKDETGQPAFICDCKAHQKNFYCRCAAAALHTYKEWLEAQRLQLTHWELALQFISIRAAVAASMMTFDHVDDFGTPIETEGGDNCWLCETELDEYGHCPNKNCRSNSGEPAIAVAATAATPLPLTAPSTITVNKCRTTGCNNTAAYPNGLCSSCDAEDMLFGTVAPKQPAPVC